MNGELNGKGRHIWANNGDIYEGQFKDGKKHGYGVHKHANGNVYQGEYRNNKIHEWGIFTYANGDEYFGLMLTARNMAKEHTHLQMVESKEVCGLMVIYQ